MTNEELEKIVRECIDESIHMSLATCTDSHPWVCEVHFAYDGELNLYFRSLSTRRHSKEIAKNPNVAGNIVRQHAIEDYPHAVYFEGAAEIVTDESDFARLAELFAARLGTDQSIVDEAKQPDGHKFYKITVKNWSAFGKFDREDGDKYILAWNGSKR